MIDSPPSLRLRLAKATDKDVLLGMFIQSTVDYAEKTYGPEVGGTAKNLLPGKKKSVTSFLRYPVVDLLKVLDAIGLAQKRDPLERVIEACGSFGVVGFLESPVGRTLTAIASGTDPMRLLGAVPAGYKAVTSFGERKFEATGPKSAVVQFRGELVGPAWHVGVFKGAFQAMYNLPVKVTASVLEPSGCDFNLTAEW